MLVSLCNSLHIQCSAVKHYTDYSNTNIQVQNENFSLIDRLENNYSFLFYLLGRRCLSCITFYFQILVNIKPCTFYLVIMYTEPYYVGQDSMIVHRNG